ncbi:MAG: class I SAM-dependent methyltransferase [Ignavibacteriaceae bacterium]|nr:class I SAM-dependent methyltransferase [Ignavibacteriaceae bacterium]
MIVGPGCESIAVRFLEHFGEVIIIVNDYDSLMQSKMRLKDEEKIKIKMMDYAHTDFAKDHFDLIYAQSSLSVRERKEIIKEIKRILKTDGVLCTGEIVSLKEPVPAFIKDIWERSGLEPLPSSDIINYFTGKGFTIINAQDLSHTLKDFYQNIRNTVANTSKKEKEENKKFYSEIKHESDVFLKLGGDKYMGFTSLIMRKTI